MHYLFAILRNGDEKDHLGWVHACEDCELEVEYDIIDITRDDWLDAILRRNYDYVLVRPSGTVSYYKHLCDERMFILSEVLNKKIYPTFTEMLIYENKRMLAYWLRAMLVPHQRSWVFYNKDSALDFADVCKLPLVVKTAFGASGSGVSIMRQRHVLKDYIKRAFSNKGIRRKWGPNFRRGEIWNRFLRRMKDIPQSYRYFRDKRIGVSTSEERWYVLLQEYIDCAFEWRAVRIGNSYFAHKKIRKIGEMFSGTSEIAWDCPRMDLFDFVKHICEKGEFHSEAIDIFEDQSGRYLVNELQCFFGSKNPYQMKVNGVPGRYIYRDNQWIFEGGNFNTNDSFDLRLRHVFDLIERDIRNRKSL